MLKLNREDWQAIELLLKPSWLSGIVMIIAALVISGGTIIAFEFHNDGLTQDLLSWQQRTKPVEHLTTPDQIVTAEKPTLATTWPLLIVWSLAGLVIYGIAASIVHVITTASEVKEQVNYMNADSKALLETTAEHIVLRVIGTILLIAGGIVFIKLILPYCITASYAAAADLFSALGVLYAAISFSLIIVSVHILTIALRLSFGRARVFTTI